VPCGWCTHLCCVVLHSCPEALRKNRASPFSSGL
jgi:hypothetical protein